MTCPDTPLLLSEALAVATIDEAGWTSRVIVSSFELSTLRAVRASDSRLALGMLWGVAADPWKALAVAVSAGFIAVHPFVVSVDGLLAMVAAGVDGIITDRPAEAIAAVSASAGHRVEWRGPPGSTKMVGHERRRMRQADP